MSPKKVIQQNILIFCRTQQELTADGFPKFRPSKFGLAVRSRCFDFYDVQSSKAFDLAFERNSIEICLLMLSNRVQMAQ